MKDILITSRRIKIELITFLICFVVANLFNLYSIIIYHTKLVEMFTSLGYVTMAAIVIYGLWSLVRLLIYAIKLLFWND